jgi:hypothetical protein
MDANTLRGKIERRAKFGNMTMASQAQSDRTEPIHPRAFFDISDSDVEDLILTGGAPIRGHLEWEDGETTQFEVTNVLTDLTVVFGRWDLPS